MTVVSFCPVYHHNSVQEGTGNLSHLGLGMLHSQVLGGTVGEPRLLPHLDHADVCVLHTRILNLHCQVCPLF